MDELAGSGGFGAEAALMSALSDPDSAVRARAARALGGLGSARAVEPILDLLEDEHADVRDAAVRALRQLGTAAWTPCARRWQRGDVRIRRLCAEALDEASASHVAFGILDDGKRHRLAHLDRIELGPLALRTERVLDLVIRPGEPAEWARETFVYTWTEKISAEIPDYYFSGPQELQRLYAVLYRMGRTLDVQLRNEDLKRCVRETETLRLQVVPLPPHLPRIDSFDGAFFGPPSWQWTGRMTILTTARVRHRGAEEVGRWLRARHPKGLEVGWLPEPGLVILQGGVSRVRGALQDLERFDLPALAPVSMGPVDLRLPAALEELARSTEVAEVLFTPDGGALACLVKEGRVLRLDARGRRETYVDKVGVRELRAPRGLSLDAHGGLYITSAAGLGYKPVGGRARPVLPRGIGRAGVQLTRSGGDLLLTAGNPLRIEMWRILAPGKLERRREVYVSDAAVDGAGPGLLQVDALGRMYLLAGSLLVIGPDRNLEARIPVPHGFATQGLIPGGAKGRDLLLRGAQGWLRLPLGVAAARAPADHDSPREWGQDLLDWAPENLRGCAVFTLSSAEIIRELSYGALDQQDRAGLRKGIEDAKANFAAFADELQPRVALMLFPPEPRIGGDERPGSRSTAQAPSWACVLRLESDPQHGVAMPEVAQRVLDMMQWDDLLPGETSKIDLPAELAAWIYEDGNPDIPLSGSLAIGQIGRELVIANSVHTARKVMASRALGPRRAPLGRRLDNRNSWLAKKDLGALRADQTHFETARRLRPAKLFAWLRFMYGY